MRETRRRLRSNSHQSCIHKGISLYYKYHINMCHMFKIVIRRVSLRGMELYINNENAGGAQNGKLHVVP